MMKAARFRGSGELRVEEIPVPQPAPGEVVVRPAVVGVCGTDSHILAGDYPARPPVTLGHEIAGYVVQLGPGTPDTELQAGDLVTIEPHRYCGWCAYCRRGLEHMCPRKQAYGVHLDGGMAELLAVPARLAYPLPAGVTAAIGALTEPLACCVHGMDRLGARAGLPVIVFGTGPAGALLVALARHGGLQPIVAVDGRADRRDLALRMGADIALDPAGEDITAAASEVTGGIGFPYLIDAVGSADVLETCVQLACRAATILVFGVAPPSARLRISPNDIYARELTITGTAINPYTHSRAVGLLRRLPLHELGIACFPLADAAAAVAASRAGTQDKVQIVLDA